jgi:hypothetical protein
LLDGQVDNPLLYSYCVRLSETNPAPKLGIRLTASNPIQPRNSTVQWFLLYAVKLSMLPFAMHSAPIPAGVASGASRASLVSRAPQLPITASVPTRVLDRFVNPFFSYCYELLFPQLLCFDNHLRCPLVFRNTPYPQLSVLCAGALRSILTPLLTHSCGLLVVTKKVNSFAIRQIQTLLAKYPGWGCLENTDPRTFRRSRLSRRSATWTRHAHPTIIAVSSRFQVHG